jgi:hypothetical protein
VPGDRNEDCGHGAEAARSSWAPASSESRQRRAFAAGA